MVMKPGKHHSSKQRCQDLGCKVHSAQSFVLCSYTMHELRNQYNTFLASSSVRSKQLLCFVHGQDQKREQKSNTTTNFVGFHNHFPLLTMFTITKIGSYKLQKVADFVPSSK